jgi:hypothetical protein
MLLPGIMGVELMVEAARLLLPGFHVRRVEDVRFDLAVKILRGRPVDLRIRARAETPDGSDHDERRVTVRVESDFVNTLGAKLSSDRLHYAATVVLGGSRTAPIPWEGALPGTSGRRSADAIYGPILPLGPTFHVVREIGLIEGKGALAALAPLDERAAFSVDGLAAAPLEIEAMFQAACLWQALTQGTLGLPHTCRRLEHLGAPPAGMPLRAIALVTPDARGSFEYATAIVGEDGLVYDRMEGFRTVSAAETQGAGVAESAARVRLTASRVEPGARRAPTEEG